MTKTPLDEFLHAILVDVFFEHPPCENVAHISRDERIKTQWRLACAELPDDGMAQLLVAPDCEVLLVADPVLGSILYHKITYGEHSVVECEGVVVCQLT